RALRSLCGAPAVAEPVEDREQRDALRRLHEHRVAVRLVAARRLRSILDRQRHSANPASIRVPLSPVLIVNDSESRLLPASPMPRPVLLLYCPPRISSRLRMPGPLSDARTKTERGCAHGMSSICPPFVYETMLRASSLTTVAILCVTIVLAPSDSQISRARE